jgi:hypothetical protein
VSPKKKYCVSHDYESADPTGWTLFWLLIAFAASLAVAFGVFA